MRKPHSLSEAETSRDSFSKALYDRLFSWIVGHVNAAIDPALTEAASDDTVSNFVTRGLYYKTFCGRNLQISVIS
jgi:myosin heavy subunit